MSTTSVIIEHLICGVHSLIWIALAVLTFTGFQWIELPLLLKFSPQISLIVLSFAYPLGIFIDEIADFLLDKQNKKIRNTSFKKEGLEGDAYRTTAFFLLQEAGDDFIREYFNYIRTRIRIARAATLNFTLITIFIVPFSYFQLNLSCKLIFIMIVVGVFGVVMAYMSWRKFASIFSEKIARAFIQKNKLTSDYGVK